MIFIASDHGGFELKKYLCQYLQKNKRELTDLGPYKFNQDDDFPDYAEKVANAVSASEGKDIGVLICKSGVGVQISANKVKGAYATLCTEPIWAKLSREHDNANILCLSADLFELKKPSIYIFILKFLSKVFRVNFYRQYTNKFQSDILRVFLQSDFLKTKARFERRFKKIKLIEKNGL